MTQSKPNNLGIPGHQTTSSTAALEADPREKPSQVFFLAAILAALTAYFVSGLATA